MKETEFKPGEYCNFTKEEISKLLDDMAGKIPFNFAHSAENNDCLLIDKNGKLAPFSTCLMTDGYLEYVEISREQFMFKATRGKGVKPEFDPSKDWEISNDGKTWFPGENYDFIGFHDKKPVVFWKSDNRIVKYSYIRNTPEPFNARMLGIGEWMQVTQIGPYEDWVVQMTSENTLHCPEYAKTLFGCNDLKGKRVKVNITTEEI